MLPQSLASLVSPISGRAHLSWNLGRTPNGRRRNRTIRLQCPRALLAALEKRLEVVKSYLETLGDARTSQKERMRYLTRISKDYGELVKDALDGDYSHAFFKDGDLAKRLRATTMALTDSYERSMRTRGHAFEMCSANSQPPQKQPHGPEQITEADALLKVGKLLETYRGPELSFLFNPRLVGELFKEQSQKWPLVTSEYISDICLAVQTFLGKVLAFICPSTGETSDLVFQHVLDDAVQSSFESLDSKTGELFSPYTKSFLFSIKSRLHASLKRIELEALQQENASATSQRPHSSGPEIMGSDHDTRVKLLQYSRAYYDVALETYIDNVVILGVESCLLSKLEVMFSADTVVQMDENMLNLIGSESADMQSEREELSRQLETLSDSLKRCRRHTSRLTRSQAKMPSAFQTELVPNEVDREGESHQAALGRVVEENAISKTGILPQARRLNGDITHSSIFNPMTSHPTNPPQASTRSLDTNGTLSFSKSTGTSQTSTPGSIFSFPSVNGFPAAPSVPIVFGHPPIGAQANAASPRPTAAFVSTTP